MTTIDKSKLKRIITQCGSQDEMEMVRAVWNAAQAEEREECRIILNKEYESSKTRESFAWDHGYRMASSDCISWLEMSNSKLLLMAGEMSAQELRTVRAVLNAMANKIRQK